jgi:putative transcriptional regulator
MNAIRSIRQRLGLTQQALADGLGVTQGNVSLYEHGQEMPPKVARRLVAFADQCGTQITLDDVYAESSGIEEQGGAVASVHVAAHRTRQAQS